MLSIFPFVCWLFLCLPWRNICWDPLLTFKLDYLPFLWSSKSSLYILDTSPLSGRYMICKYSLPFCGLSFFFFHGVPWITNVFNFGKYSLFIFVLWLLAYSAVTKKPLLSQGHMDWLLYSLVILSSFYLLHLGLWSILKFIYSMK